MQKRYDIIVVGAGPAGLGFCASAAAWHKLILLVEAGKPLAERDSSRPEELASGVSGAGIYIDGKFSSFPAGTDVWRCAYDLLAAGFAEMCSLLQPFADVALPPMPSEQEILDYFFCPEAVWKLKQYKSIYLDETKRFAFLNQLIAIAERNAELLCNTRVLGITKSSQAHSNFAVTLRLDCGEIETVHCSELVLAGGRFMPLQGLMKNIDAPQKHRFRRHEFGIRLQVPFANPGVQAMTASGCLDPKYVLQPRDNVQFRTFCFCKRGLVCKSEIDGLQTFSGRADVEPTEFTNFGLMARTLDPLAFEQADIDRFLEKPFEISLQGCSNLRNYAKFELLRCCGEKIGLFIWEALEQIFILFGELCCEELRLFGPCLEGVGVYPNTNQLLQVESVPHMYAIGDASGTFRGLMPSLLSGFYLAHSLKALDRAPLLLTSNKDKVLEISAALGMLPTLPLLDGGLEDCDAVAHARAKASLALFQTEHQRHALYLLVEVSSLEIDVLNGYPGVHVRSFFERLGVETIFKLAQGSGATFISVLALVNTRTQHIQCFKGSCRGVIVPPSGANGFDWDCLFQPEGYDLTYGDMSRIVKTKISARFYAAQQLRQFLANHINS